MPPFVVSPAAAHELLPACRLLFSAGRAEHYRDRLLSDERTSGLFVARDERGRVRAAALVQILPGALGVAWAPRGDSDRAVDAAAGAAGEWLRAGGVKVCQAFAASGEVAEMGPLERHGFRHATQLVFMRRELTYDNLPDQPKQSFTYCPEQPPLSEEFRRVLLATHEGSLDCPELNGARTPEELLAGFAEAMPGGGWNLVRRDTESVGVVIHADGAEPETVDITYFGILPAHRGRGEGGGLLAQSLCDFYHACVRVLTLSVDARNTPAMKLYARHGFVEYDRREVWLATWSA